MNKPTVAAHKAVLACLEAQTEKIAITDQLALLTALREDVEVRLADLDAELVGESED